MAVSTKMGAPTGNVRGAFDGLDAAMPGGPGKSDGVVSFDSALHGRRTAILDDTRRDHVELTQDPKVFDEIARRLD
jgi:hypothetical protein